MSNLFLSLIEEEIEKRAASRAAQMFAEWREKSEKPTISEDIAHDGTVIRPFILGGIKYITRKEAAALLCIKMPALWRWTEKDHLLTKKKLGRKVYYLYDDVVNLAMKGEQRKDLF